jgi:uncharacterized DUF497 family protein
MPTLTTFEWDDEKAQANIEKHGISFEQAKTIFNGPVWSWVDKRFSYGEIRLITIGLVEETAVIVVVHTDRNGITRLISARPANRKERRRYDEEIHKALDG